MHVRNKTEGFTLIEMMIVVVIIAILAAVAIVAYVRHVKSSRLVKEKVFVAAIQSMQETYFQQNGFYLDVTGGAYEPAGNAPDDKVIFDATSFTSWTNWGDLGARPEGNHTYFQWNVTASDPAANHAAPASPPTGVTLSAGSPWYYIHARGDFGGDGAPYTELFATSDKTTVWILNEGE